MTYPATMPAIDDRWADGPATGRHAFDEDAALTPIFHALARGARRLRAPEPAADPVDAFRRDPLTAPIPVVLVPAPTRYRLGTPPAAPGRHHRRGHQTALAG